MTINLLYIMNPRWKLFSMFTRNGYNGGRVLEILSQLGFSQRKLEKIATHRTTRQNLVTYKQAMHFVWTNPPSPAAVQYGTRPRKKTPSMVLEIPQMLTQFWTLLSEYKVEKCRINPAHVALKAELWLQMATRSFFW